LDGIAMAPQNTQDSVLESLARQTGLLAKDVFDAVDLVILGKGGVLQHGQAYLVDRVRHHGRVMPGASRWCEELGEVTARVEIRCRPRG
jgi:hypothetical protein